MAEKNSDSSASSEINTLEDSLKRFDMECLLEQLDISLESVRRGNETKKDHLYFMKSIDKNLLKLSLIHHPDKVLSGKKSDREIENAQKMQVALNVTRTVLQALTKAFLEDIDTQYRYEFFAKMDINTLINEKEMDRQINNVLFNISLLSEVKRVNIVGVIRKFLVESRKSLKSFQDDDKKEFERHRDYSLCYMHKCIEGYSILVTECKMVAKECSGELGAISRNAIEKISAKSQTELNILEALEKDSKKSIEGNFKIFTIYEHPNRYDYYHISPFVLYINLMMMCTTVMNGKLGYLTRIKNYIKPNTYISPKFNRNSEHLFLKAYNLASFFYNKTQEVEYAVEIILQKKGQTTSTDNIITEFKLIVSEIERFLEAEFDINTYKEGKNNRQQFTETLSKLNESTAGYKEVEKLQEELKLCKNETREIRKKYFEFSEKIQENEVQSQENILKCKNTSEEFAKLIYGYNQIKDTRRISRQAKASENESCIDIEEDSTEIKLENKLEQYEKIAENILDFLTDCRQNISKFTGRKSSSDNQKEYFSAVTGNVEKKMKAIYELNKKINEQLYYLMTQSSTKKPEGILKQDNLNEENLKGSPLKKSNDVKTEDKTGKCAVTYHKLSNDVSAPERNVAGFKIKAMV